MSKNTIGVYAAGGCGANIVSGFPINTNIDLTAKVTTTYIDTSRSNIKKNMSPDDIYLVPDLDGSGKVRSENHEEIANVIKDILVKHKPQDFNVVVFSLSGGSGSVVAPLLMAEMLRRDIPVVGICVGTDESVLTANNTMKTLKSLDAIAASTGKPVVIFYMHNERGTLRSEVDARARSYIAGLTYLTSGVNEELDSQDLANWLNFTRTTSLNPQLALMEVFSDAAHVESKHKNPVSIASLYSNTDTQGLSVVPEYHCAGYTDLSDAKVTELHFVIDVQYVPDIARRIESTLRTQKEVADSRPQQGSLVSSKDVIEKNGLVL